MEMKEFNITIPKEMFVYLAIDEDRSELERNAMMLYPYVKNFTISHGRAAEILGISKWELITLYDNIGLPYLDTIIYKVTDMLYIYARIPIRLTSHENSIK